MLSCFIVIIFLLTLNSQVSSFNLHHQSHYYKTWRPIIDNKDIISMNMIKTDDKIDNNRLLNRINEYMFLRNSTSTESVQVNSKESFFAFLKPSGWYKDKEEIEFKKRIDSRIPKEEYRHPLSYVDLKRYGFDDLIEPIMELGGPYEVGEKLLGYNWVEAKERWDESLRPVRVETWAMDIKGSLLLGDALDEVIAGAERLDLTRLKTEAEEKRMTRLEEATMEGRSESAGDGEDYRAGGRQVTKRSRSESRLELDRFSLDSPQRIYFLAACASFALAYGRSSAELVGSGADGIKTVVDLSSLLFPIAATANMCSAVWCYGEASKKNRDRLIWTAQGILGGPLVVLQLARSKSRA